MQDELERMMDRMEMDVELIMKKMHKTIDRLQSRKEILKKFPGHAARLRVYRSIEELAEQMQQLHEHILSGLAKRTGQEGKKGNSRLLMSESDDLSSEDRVHQLEEMLKVMPVSCVSVQCTFDTYRCHDHDELFLSRLQMRLYSRRMRNSPNSRALAQGRH